MSGPKVSQVNLDIQRRAELQRERERKSKIIFEIKNKVKILNNIICLFFISSLLLIRNLFNYLLTNKTL